MHWRRLHPGLYADVPWRNGGGMTREIALRKSAGDPSHSLWRLSLAQVAQSGPYSEFPGQMRAQALLAGEGLRLNFADARLIELTQRLKPVVFEGVPAPSAELIEGPVQVANLIWDPVAVQAQLLTRPLVGAMVLFLPPQTTWVIYLLAGQAELRLGERSELLGQEEGVVLDSDQPQAERAVLSGGGEVILVKLEAPAG